MAPETVGLIAVVTAVVGGVVGWLAERLLRGAAYQGRAQILEQARVEADSLLKSRELGAKEELLKRREEIEKELGTLREGLRDQEKRLERRDALVTEQLQDLGKKERLLELKQKKLTEETAAIEARSSELESVLRNQRDSLERISGLDAERARAMVLERCGQELKSETGALILKHEQELKQNSDRLAREIIGMAVQRYAAAHTSETSVSSIDIPNDDVKGRIIGREGRNIRAFEKATGVDVIVDDTPGVVIVSAFDAVRRETAKLALTKLIQDGRIHPSRIEEIVQETRREIDAQIRRSGREAAQEVGVHGLHEKLVELMGRLSFRTSYSQNVLRHSVEVAYLTGLLAEQLKLDGNLARRCGFLHDIGKAADHEMEGGHPAVGAELLKRYGECAEVVHAAAGHHDDIRVDYIYTVLVAAADAISAARPGARRESLERYIKRLEELETLACGFPGVEQAFAVQAGREIRVVVNPKVVSDREAARLCRDIAQAIEDALTYPGEIKVNVLRETRHSETAR
jgi:ribonuclease Y